jgi:hypothetical protein
MLYGQFIWNSFYTYYITPCYMYLISILCISLCNQMSNVEKNLKSFTFAIWLPIQNHETQISKHFKFVKHKSSFIVLKEESRKHLTEE